MKITRIAAVTASVAVALALTGCGAGSDDSGDKGGKVTLKFQSLAFQDTTVKATKDIVAAWNQAHPDVHVDYVQGSWDSVQDQLTTQFQGGTAPDIIQYESAGITGFAQQGYLADLGDKLGDVKSDVPDPIWKTVTVDDKIVAAPTLLQSYIVFANTDLLKKAGVTVPTGDTWSWDDLRAAAKAATKDGTYGLGFGLSQPTASMLSFGLNFGGTYFTGSGDDADVKVGDAELAVPERIHQMAYDDKSLDPVTLTQSGSDVMTAFLKGKYALTVQGSYAAQTLAESAPADFHWAALPVLAGDSADQSANPQTMSVAAESKHVDDAADFIDFYMKAENLAKVAEGDWLIPASTSAAEQVKTDTKDANGWPTILASLDHLVAAPFQSVTNYPQWKDQIATPAFQKYLGNDISADELAKELEDGWKSVNGG
ncbi:carbohydrate ABC transporter substrate-binding protein, CUT1 family (TC 3.A.1.1.-) [Nocardioides terrae]|uniref:Carbohydrate ABC transporter substrate-binding protein, CUT1 family (TC 3.A.1.1.-) n=1 Tax=Nocardioides terrae TaxID=574651 RepID=A0A1I1KHP7_9ACTN|nr:sugar ABC transporter substrate-binding protein [Nocardioides terrae]SFC58198.1 carbohydrate ABC transporter substrate-binding protein, CUT1 family (TC 3.A.1.1.-) [Nocardioides terrae]